MNTSKISLAKLYHMWADELASTENELRLKSRRQSDHHRWVNNEPLQEPHLWKPGTGGKPRKNPENQQILTDVLFAGQLSVTVESQGLFMCNMSSLLFLFNHVSVNARIEDSCMWVTLACRSSVLLCKKSTSAGMTESAHYLQFSLLSRASPFCCVTGGSGVFPEILCLWGCRCGVAVRVAVGLWSRWLVVRQENPDCWCWPK